MKEKVRAIKALDWFRKNICAKKCKWKGIESLFCYEKMRKIITGFEDYLITYEQFIYSMRIKNKVCDLDEAEFKKSNEKQGRIDEEFEEIEASLMMPDETEYQSLQLEQLELEEREEFFLPDSEINDYDEDGDEIESDKVDLDDLEIEKDEETGMYKLKQ